MYEEIRAGYVLSGSVNLNYDKDGGNVFAELCERVGLPRPNEVQLCSVSVSNEVPKASKFVSPEEFATRLRADIWLRFDKPVHGPVLIGAGQFSGFGRCRPRRLP